METADEYALASKHRYQAKTSRIIPHQDTSTGSTPQITETATGRQFYFGYGRSKGMGISLLLFGLFIAVFAYYFFRDFLDFLPTTSLMAAYVGLTALTLFLFGLLLIANSLTIQVGLMGIKKQQRIFGFQIEEIIDADDIVDIITEQNASSSSGNTTRVWFRLNLISREGQSMEVGDSLEGSHAPRQYFCFIP